MRLGSFSLQGLFLTTSDVDNSGKSYYGETNLYLVGLNGQFECKVALGESGDPPNCRVRYSLR